MSDNPFNQHILGETDQETVCIGAEENEAAVIAMLKQADRHVDVLSYTFEPHVYNTAACHDAFKDFVLRGGRYAQVRVLLHDPATVARYGHQVLELGKQLSSFFQFRRVAHQHRTRQETFLLVDGIGVMYRPYADTLKSLVNFCDGSQARRLQAHFDHLWAHGEQDPNLRQIVI